MAVHTVYVTPTPTLSGSPIAKESATISQMMNADTEMRVVPDIDVPNSAARPTIKAYIEAENGDGFLVKSVTNTTIITES